MRDLRQRLDELEDLVFEVLLFVAEVASVVLGVLYYVMIGVTMIVTFVMPQVGHVGSMSWFARDPAILSGIELCVGAAMLWGLTHVVAKALAARQASRRRGINSTKLHGR